MFSLITLQGFPTAITLSGISFVTTLPAPITTLFPIVTPGRIIAPPPIQTLSPIITGAVLVLQNQMNHPLLTLQNDPPHLSNEKPYISAHWMQSKRCHRVALFPKSGKPNWCDTVAPI